MATEIEYTDDAAKVLSDARDFLASDPVSNNVMLTLLLRLSSAPEPGRYWIARRDGEVAGVVFQSPLHFPALLTRIDLDLIEPIVDVLIDRGVELPGAGSEPLTAAAFAGQWAERYKTQARVTMTGRQYECREVVPPPDPAAGELRLADEAEFDLLVKWIADFYEEADTLRQDPSATLRRVMDAGQLWVWDDDGPVSMTINSDAAEGVARVQAVYTPPENRGKGYASVAVATLTGQILSQGLRCILFTDLANPISNSVYQRIGYRRVQEFLRFEFG